MSLRRSDCLCILQLAQATSLAGPGERPAYRGRIESSPICTGNLRQPRAMAAEDRPIESPSSDQMKRSWLGPDRRGDSFVVRRVVSRSVSLAGSEMIGTYLTSASTTDERYGVPRPTCARRWAASWRRGSSAPRTPHPAAFSPRVTSHFRRRTYRYRYRYICTRVSRAMSRPSHPVGRSCNSVHACLYVLYVLYTTLRSTWTAETSIIDGRRLTADG